MTSNPRRSEAEAPTHVGTPVTSEASPSAHGHELWQIPNAQALALVDQQLGPPEAWAGSALLNYRLSADFQADWKAEVGHWLHAARQFGFLEQMLRPVFGERERKRVNPNRDGHDPRHLKLHQHLASAMMCHYFTGLGWSFAGWETETGGAIDIDLALNSPDATLVEFQIKAPDQPGIPENGRYRDGNFDHRVVEALDHAADQLPKETRSVALVGMFAQRDFHLSLEPTCVIRHLFGGPTINGEAGLFLAREMLGQFLLGTWNHVAGVVLLDILRSSKLVEDECKIRFLDSLTYPCTVLLNPNSEMPASPDWFPRARVLVLEGDTFRWFRGHPPEYNGILTGTRVAEQLSEP